MNNVCLKVREKDDDCKWWFLGSKRKEWPDVYDDEYRSFCFVQVMRINSLFLYFLICLLPPPPFFLLLLSFLLLQVPFGDPMTGSVFVIMYIHFLESFAMDERENEASRKEQDLSSLSISIPWSSFRVICAFRFFFFFILFSFFSFISLFIPSCWTWTFSPPPHFILHPLFPSFFQLPSQWLPSKRSLTE